MNHRTQFSCILTPFSHILMILLLFFFVYNLSYQAAALNSQVAVLSPAVSHRHIVVIDSGHGGNDPGKVGVNGALEKDINLQIAKRLKQYLEASDVQVVMTRDNDTGLYSEHDTNKKMADMQARCRLINETAPALVVSIHQNSYHEESVRGGQVFYYKGSSDGKRLAETLQKRFTSVSDTENRRLAKANDTYYLLLHTKHPIVIVECGFLSNQQETALLTSPDYQDRLAWTIHMGIMEYLNSPPAPSDA